MLNTTEVQIRNILGDKINPAREETLIEIKNSIVIPKNITTADGLTVGTARVSIPFSNGKGTIVLQSMADNTAPIYIGKDDVYASGNKSLIRLDIGQSISFSYDTADVGLYAISSSANQSLRYTILPDGFTPVNFGSSNNDMIPILSSISAIAGNISDAYAKSEFVQGSSLVRIGGVDYPRDNEKTGHHKERIYKNQRSDSYNVGGDHYAATARDINNGGGVLGIDLARKHFDQDKRTICGLDFSYRSALKVSESGVIEITIWGWDDEERTYQMIHCPVNIFVSPETMFITYNYTVKIKETVLDWNRDDSRFGYVFFRDVYRTLTAPNLEFFCSLIDYQFK
jgi:hypothetical protein